MSEQKIKFWDAMRTPPKQALKEIRFGNLKGKHDINPQWRIQVMTETFGPCGVGWRYTVVDRWTEHGPQDTVAAFVSVELRVVVNDKWSEAIPGTGGSMLVIKDKNGLHINDECYKMATTDALSVAMKQLGVAADIYMGIMDGSKYTSPSPCYDQAVALVKQKKDSLSDETLQWCRDTVKANPQAVIDHIKGL